MGLVCVGFREKYGEGSAAGHSLFSLGEIARGVRGTVVPEKNPPRRDFFMGRNAFFARR